MTVSPTFKTVHSSVRPARVAVLIDCKDNEWEQTCLHVIGFFSQLWGGAYNLIVPTDGQTIDERFWTILEAFDPDYVYAYRKSGEDIRLNTPQKYEQIVDTHVKSWLSQFGQDGVDSAEIKAQIDKDLRRSWVSEFAITSQLQNEIKIRLAPFYLEHWIVEAGSISAGSVARFPLTSLVQIINNAEHPDRFANINVPSNLLPKLWYSASTGLLPEKATEEFEAAGLKKDRYDFNENEVGQLVEFVVSGEIRGPWVFRPNERFLLDLNGIVPFRISMLQLGLYRPAKYPGWAEPLVFVVGNSVEDFCLYYCLSRLRGDVAWVLPSITTKALSGSADPISRVEMSFANQLHNWKHSQRSQGELAYASFSLSDAAVEAVVSRMGSYRGKLEAVSKAKGIEHLVHMPLVAIERDNFQRDLIVQVSDDLTISPFSTPKPKNFHTIHPYEHRYITQLAVAKEGPPKHFALGTWTILENTNSTKQVRVGKEGPAYFCPNVAYFGGDIDTVLVRPHLRLSSLHKIVSRLARAEGYECRPSDKGIYADETIAKWGGLSEAAGFLRDDGGRGLLDQFLDQSKSATGKGVYLHDRRRYLDFACIKMHVGTRAGNVIDDLITKRILYRGFIFLCSFCRSAAWFSVSELTQEFKCKRCGRSQVYTRSSWKMPEEPVWYYKLDELVYQGYRHGMAVSLLALDFLRQQSTDNFSFSTDCEFWKPGASKPEAEVDWFCVSDGVLTVGEAKKEDCLGKSVSEENHEIAKYKHIAVRLAARRFTLATFNDEWRKSTVERVTSAFLDTPSVKIEFLTSQKLLSAGA